MHKTLSALTVLAAVVAFEGTAQAQEDLGQKGNVAFGVDRVFGIYFSHRNDEFPAPIGDQDFDSTSIGIGWRGRTATPYEVARFAFDIFVIDSLSIGGSVGYSSTSYDDDDDNNDDDFADFIFSPRVGYFIGFNDTFGFWPRGGFTYHSSDVDPGGGESGFGLTLEGMFTISPVPHFGFMVGPIFDIDFTGERDAGQAGDLDRTYRTFGITAGLFGWL